MSTITKQKPGRKAMNTEQKKKGINCVLKPETMEELKKDVEAGKANTPNQRITQIIELFYRNKEL